MRIKYNPGSLKGVTATGEADGDGNRTSHELAPELRNKSKANKSNGQGILARILGLRRKPEGSDRAMIGGGKLGHIAPTVAVGCAAIRELTEAGIVASPEMASAVESLREDKDYSERVSSAYKDGAPRVLELSAENQSTVVYLRESEEKEFFDTLDASITDKLLIFRQLPEDGEKLGEIARNIRAYSKEFVTSNTREGWNGNVVSTGSAGWRKLHDEITTGLAFVDAIPVYSPEALHDHDELKSGLEALLSLANSREEGVQKWAETIDSAFAYYNAEYEQMLVRPDAAHFGKRKGKPKKTTAADMADVL